MQGLFMCECCPKKPKKFETAEDLKAHEAEKQYNCQYCGNRFKNKNEAERHQNSLHVRPHSWSCSALKDYKRAFHESNSRPYEADTCGYCGEDFSRSGRSPGSNGPRYATERDWEERSRHLQDCHEFGECNTSKKFFRADNFRQHLKHSHAGVSGKWTNMLETACMINEEPVQHR
uniref:C2H2-type domain-containing protein n=1 Tax=Bionectria ochroleuca TaxID=29856 RepID=A0A8H7K6C3_BIOOC